MRDMIAKALDNVGGIAYLEEQARNEPKAFLALIGKLLPLQVTGDGGGPLAFEQIVRTVVDPKK